MPEAEGAQHPPPDGPPLGQQQGKGHAMTWCSQATKPFLGPLASLASCLPFTCLWKDLGEAEGGSEQVSGCQATDLDFQ